MSNTPDTNYVSPDEVDTIIYDEDFYDEEIIGKSTKKLYHNYPAKYTGEGYIEMGNKTYLIEDVLGNMEETNEKPE